MKLKTISIISILKYPIIIGSIILSQTMNGQTTDKTIWESNTYNEFELVKFDDPNWSSYTLYYRSVEKDQIYKIGYIGGSKEQMVFLIEQIIKTIDSPNESMMTPSHGCTISKKPYNPNVVTLFTPTEGQTRMDKETAQTILKKLKEN